MAQRVECLPQCFDGGDGQWVGGAPEGFWKSVVRLEICARRLGGLPSGREDICSARRLEKRSLGLWGSSLALTLSR